MTKADANSMGSSQVGHRPLNHKWPTWQVIGSPHSVPCFLLPEHLFAREHPTVGCHLVLHQTPGWFASSQVWLTGLGSILRRMPSWLRRCGGSGGGISAPSGLVGSAAKASPTATPDSLRANSSGSRRYDAARRDRLPPAGRGASAPPRGGPPPSIGCPAPAGGRAPPPDSALPPPGSPARATGG